VSAACSSAEPTRKIARQGCRSAGDFEAFMNSPSRRARPVNSPETVDPAHEFPTHMPGDDDTDLHGPLSALPDEDQSELSSTRVIGDPSMVEAGLQPAPDPEQKSVVIGGDYQLVKKLGEGAMGAVYRARQISFDRDVAIKILFPHIAKIPKLVERLHREARAMALLDHPNIVQAYAIGDEGGCPFVAMEYVEGKNLQKWLNKLERIAVADAVHIVRECARGLAYAHKQGMIHRDVKPENILVTRSGQVKIADLGMVKTFDDDMALTQTGHAVGTPWYMPLEQARNAKDTDGRCDIYALGCTLYCMLTGCPPFAGATIVDVIRAKELGTFPPVRGVNPAVPERLDLVIAKMAAKLPRYRYQNCEELIADLDALQLASPTLHLGEAPPSEPVLSGRSSGEIITNPALAGELADPDIWYVRFKGPGGQAVLRKYTTAQLMKKLSDGSIEAKAKASHNARDGFRALATYKELEGAALSRASKEAADKSSIKYRNLYKKIEEQDRQREQNEKQAPRSLPPWLGMVLTIGVAMLAVIGLAAFIYYVATMLR
jgi:serine/threonine-protein kinase